MTDNNTPERRPEPKRDTISISLCPTAMEREGDILDESAIESAVMSAVKAYYPGANVDFQIGYAQGDEWYTLNGAESDAVEDIVLALDWSDESLYVDPTPEDTDPA